MDHILTVFTLFAIFLGTIFGFEDGHLIVSGHSIKKSNKRVRTRITSLIFLVVSLLVFAYFRDTSISSYLDLCRTIWKVIITEPVNVAILTMTAQLGAYWLSFDIVVNIFSDKPILYTSYKSGDENRVWSDRLFDIFPEKYAGIVQVLVKLLILVSGLSYISSVL